MMLFGPLIVFFLSLASKFATSGAADVVLPPIKLGIEACLIIIQGADIPNEAYVPLAKEIQNQSPLKLWVGIPHFPGDTAEPLVLDNGIERMLDELTKSGMEATAYFYAGHSLGGAMVQLWTDKNADQVTGQLLLGSFLTRMWKTDYVFNYRVPTITIGGELDGLARVTRFAEAYYTQLIDSNLPERDSDFPVTVVRGVSHMQFASGEPPSLVFERDLIPEVSYEEAHSAIAADMVSFMSLRVEGADLEGTALAALKSRLSETAQFVDPIIQALKYEGYHNFLPPCLCKTDVCEPMKNCTASCLFTDSVSQATMGEGGLLGLTVTNRDSFHDVWETQPEVHLPAILNSCTAVGEDQPCELLTNTITQGVYHTGEDLEVWKKHFDVPWLDSGFAPISAVELRTKMISRENTWTRAGLQNVTFEDVDGGGVRCGEINQLSLDWAKASAGATTVERFFTDARGQPYVVGPDKEVCAAGPCWIWQELEYKPSEDLRTVELISPQLATPLDYILPASAGFHYCKVLSPARAMEWLYVDGLRQFYSLKSSGN